MGKVHEVYGNVLDGGYDVVIQSCNCLNIMGGGIAREIKKRFPEVFEADKNFELPKGKARLGKFSYAEVKHDVSNKDFIILNVYGQEKISGNGPLGDGVQTDYGALENGIREGIIYLLNSNKDINTFSIPKYIGCGLGGADWSRVNVMLCAIAEDLGIDLYISEYQP